jgi:hypothetical protein
VLAEFLVPIPQEQLDKSEPRMKTDRWHKIDEIFHAALQRKPEERASFLEQNCSQDPALYADVKSLLVSYEKDDDSFFERSASALAAEMFADRVGEMIGRYEVLSELGSGAMGIVYLAQDRSQASSLTIHQRQRSTPSFPARSTRCVGSEPSKHPDSSRNRTKRWAPLHRYRVC